MPPASKAVGGCGGPEIRLLTIRRSAVPFISEPATDAGAAPDTELRSCVQMWPGMPWHFLYFLPLPQGQGSFGPILGSVRRTVPLVIKVEEESGAEPL